MLHHIGVTALVFIGTLLAVLAGDYLALAVLVGVHGGGPLDDSNPMFLQIAVAATLLLPFWKARRTWRNTKKNP